MRTKCLLLALGMLALGPSVQAQTIYNTNPQISAPYSRPALSPYMNLLRGGDPAANYYLGVLTEYDRRFRESQIGLAPSAPTFLPSGVDYSVDEGDIPVRKLSPSGHPAGFMIYQGYFNMPNRSAYIPYNGNANTTGLGGSNPNAMGNTPAFRPRR